MADEGMQIFLGAPVPQSSFWVIKLFYGLVAVLCAICLNTFGEDDINETMCISFMFLAFYELLGMKPTALVPMLNASCFKTPFKTTNYVMKWKSTGEVGDYQESSNQVVVLAGSNGVWGSQFLGWKKFILWFLYLSMFSGSVALFYLSEALPKWRFEVIFTGSVLFLSLYELIGFNPVAIAPMMKMLLYDRRVDTNAHWAAPPPT